MRALISLCLALALSAQAQADPTRWDAQTTEHLTVRLLGHVDGKPLYLEHRAGPLGGDREHVVLLRTDPFPSAAPFGVASQGKPGGVIHRLLDPGDSTKPAAVPGVVAVLYAGFVVPGPNAFRLEGGALRVQGKTETRLGPVAFDDRWRPGEAGWAKVAPQTRTPR